MKKLAAATALMLALGAGAAFADTIQNSYGNTITVTTPDGAVQLYHFNADGTFTLTMNGHAMPGTYQVSNGQICMLPTGGQQICAEYVGDKNVGDSWTQRGSDGSTINVALTAGR